MRWLFTILACLTLAGPAWSGSGVAKAGTKDNSQEGIQIQVQTADSQRVNVKSGSTAGSFSTEEASKDRDYNTVMTNVIVNNAINFAARNDSMLVPADVRGYRNLGLFLIAWGSAGTAADSLMTYARIAVQVRASASASADTGSTFPWQTMTGANTAGLIDSVGSIVQEDATTAGNGEFAWVIRHPTGLPRGVYVPLYADGQPHPPFISIRLRLLAMLTASANTRLKVRVSLVGSN